MQISYLYYNVYLQDGYPLWCEQSVKCCVRKADTFITRSDGGDN